MEDAVVLGAVFRQTRDIAAALRSMKPSAATGFVTWC